jgi:hypothetical protein
MIQGISTTSTSANTVTSIGYAIKASQRGRTSLPVSSASYIYSHFKHVSGVPAPEGVRGVAVTKLKILDVLIEQLAQMKKQPEPLTAGISNNQIDALIDQYEKQIRQARAASVVMPYAAVPQAPTGMLFSLAA